ncbi:MAG: thioredoxin family protein [Candidatus Kapaibacterium sp.]
MKITILLVSLGFASCTSHAQPQTHTDSVFSAIQTAVDIESKTLPEGYHNAELYRLLLEDNFEKRAAKIAAAISMRHLNDSSVDDEGSEDFMKRELIHDSIRRAKIVAWTPELLSNGTAKELRGAAMVMIAETYNPKLFNRDTSQLWCAYTLAAAAVARGDTSTDQLPLRYLLSYFDANGSRIARDSALKTWNFEETPPDQNNGWLTSYPKALEEARASKKNIFIDFTGHMNTNCRYMEQTIFSRDDVTQLMGQFALVRLFMDGGTAEENDNAKMEEKRFHTIAEPFYVILSPNDKPLASFPGYTRDAEAYKAFLQLKKKYLWKK